MNTTKQFIEELLRTNIEEHTRRLAITHLRYMALHPNRHLLFGFDDNAIDFTKLFCWDRAPEGAMFWLNIFKKIPNGTTQETTKASA